MFKKRKTYHGLSIKSLLFALHLYKSEIQHKVLHKDAYHPFHFTRILFYILFSFPKS
jgi:hypothetical protein